MAKKRTTKPLQWKEAKKVLLFLEAEKKYHYLLITAVGFYTGYRISDMLELKYEDFTKAILDITERKTSKQRPVPVIAELKRIVQLCQVALKRKDAHYLFVRTRFFSNQPISKAAAITRIRKALQFGGIKGKHLTAHTLRKTFALRYYELARATEGDYRALNELSKQLNHASTDITRRYIGLEEQVVQNIFDNFG